MNPRKRRRLQLKRRHRKAAVRVHAKFKAKYGMSPGTFLMVSAGIVLTRAFGFLGGPR